MLASQLVDERHKASLDVGEALAIRPLCVEVFIPVPGLADHRMQPPRFVVTLPFQISTVVFAQRIGHFDRQYGSDRRVYGKHFWATGYCVSTVGLDERQVRQYIREQEKLETGQNALEFE